MAYTLSIGAVAEITVTGRINDQIVMSLFHYRMFSGATITDGAAALNSLRSDFNTQVYPAYANLMSAMWICQGRYIQAIAPSRYRRLVPDGVGLQGSGGDCNNQTAAAVLTKYADLANRHGIGTLHLPAVPDDQMFQGKLVAGYTTLMSTLAATMDNVLSASGGSSWLPVIFNRANAVNSPAITGIKYQDTIRTMRRRVVGRGI